jgi:hypothetical protein
MRPDEVLPESHIFVNSLQVEVRGCSKTRLSLCTQAWGFAYGASFADWTSRRGGSGLGQTLLGDTGLVWENRRGFRHASRKYMPSLQKISGIPSGYAAEAPGCGENLPVLRLWRNAPDTTLPSASFGRNFEIA